MSYCSITSANVNTEPLEAFASVLQRPEPRAFAYHHDKNNFVWSATGIVVPSADTAQRVVRSLGIENVVARVEYEDNDDVTNGLTITARGEAADGLFVALDALDAWFYAGVHSITAFYIRTHETPVFSVQWYAEDYKQTPQTRRDRTSYSNHVLNQYRGDIRVMNGVTYAHTSGSILRGRMQTIATDNMYRNAARTVGNE